MSRDTNPTAEPDPGGSSAPGRSGDLELLLLAVIWGVNFSVVKAGLVELHPLVFNALRFPLAAAVLWALVRAGGAVPLPDRDDWAAVLRLALVGHVLYQLLFIYGLDHTLAGNSAIILASAPAWTAVFASLAGSTSVDRSVWAGVGVTFLGVALVVAGGARDVGFGGGTLAGDLITLAAAVGWAAYTVMGRPLIARYGALPVTAWGLWIATPLLVVAGLPALAGSSLADVSAFGWGTVAYSGILAIGVAYAIWYRSVGHIGPERTAIYANLVPLVALAAAWAWRGQPPTTAQLVGAAAVLGGVLYTRWTRERG